MTINIRLTITTMALLVPLLASCGGGGNNGSGQPAPQFPSAVEDVADNDLSNAGVPSPGDLSALSTRSASLLGDYSRERYEFVDDYLVVNNLSQTQSGLVTDVPDGEQYRRIIAWALWELPAEQGDHLSWLEADIEFAPASTRTFFALANATTGFWEIGGAIGGIGPETLHFDIDGNDDSMLSPNFRFGFSNSQDYIWPNGSAYLLVAIGHPGNANYNGISMDLDGWDFRTFTEEMEDAYAQGTDGTCAWGDRLFNYIEQQNLYRQDFVLDDTQGSEHILFAQPMDFLGGSDGSGPVSAMGVVDAADYTIWRGAFFRPGEMNCLIHPFTLHRIGGTEEDLNAAPLLELPNGNGNGIIAILIGRFGIPVPFADVQLSGDGGNLNLKTNIYGQLELPLSQSGSYLLQTSWTQLDGIERGVAYDIDVDVESGYYRFR